MADLEEKLVQELSKVLLEQQEVEGLDEDLVQYIAGMLATKEDDEDDQDMNETLEEVLHPFLESVQCPEHLVTEAEDVVKSLLSKQTPAETQSTTRKLTQGVVSMSLQHKESEHEADANRYLWSGEGAVKAMANDLIDAHKDRTSSKDKRKARKAEAAEMRQALSVGADDGDIDAGLVKMRIRSVTGNAAQDKARDVLVRQVTLSLDNGKVLLDSGELKFAYQRRYGLIGENGVGKVRESSVASSVA